MSANQRHLASPNLLVIRHAVAAFWAVLTAANMFQKGRSERFSLTMLSKPWKQKTCSRPALTSLHQRLASLLCAPANQCWQCFLSQAGMLTTLNVQFQEGPSMLGALDSHANKGRLTQELKSIMRQHTHTH